MKTLLIIRHAKSSWDYPELSDHDRPLNKRGKKDIPRMGNYLKKKGIFPEFFLSSTARRAKKTAKGIAKALGPDSGSIKYKKGMYHADEDEILEYVQKLPESSSSAAIFGHNPGFTDFAESLTGEDIYNIPTCGICIVEFKVASWKEIRFGTGVLVEFIYPKGL